jgi:hypothetical protein
VVAVRNPGTSARSFEKRADADRYDANVRADLSLRQYIDPRDGQLLVKGHGESWRAQQLHRNSTAERVLRLHIYPLLGHLQLAQVRSSHIRAWAKDRAAVLSASTPRVVYGGVLVPMFQAAVHDRLIGASPCVWYSVARGGGQRLHHPDTGAGACPVWARCRSGIGRSCDRRVWPARWRGCFGLELDVVDFLRRELAVRHQMTVLTGRCRGRWATPRQRSL